MRATALTVATLATTAVANDPYKTWVAWTEAECPAGTKMTSFNGYWILPEGGMDGMPGGFNWIGAGVDNGANLIQPVLGWNMNSQGWGMASWSIVWHPSSGGRPAANHSKQLPAKTGDGIYGSMLWNDKGGKSRYDIDAAIDGAHTGLDIVSQKGANGAYKNMTKMYVVYEYHLPCNQYPKSGYITFRSLEIECDGKPFIPAWTAHSQGPNYGKGTVCDMHAHVPAASTVEFTWNTKSENHPTEDMLAYSKKHLAERQQ